MSSYESLLSLSPEGYWIGGGEFGGGSDVEAAAAASSFLSFDLGVVYHPPEPAPALVDALQAETDCRASGVAGSSNDGVEPGEQSQTEASALSSEGDGGR